jgi:hypothetical protein
MQAWKASYAPLRWKCRAYRTGGSNNDNFHALTFRSFAIADVYHHGARA